MAFFLLLFGHVVLLLAVAEVHANPRPNLQCSNDYERMFCQLDLKNCLEYNLTLQSDSGFGNKHCILQQCYSEKCCCDVEMVLVFGETHTATVQKGGKSLESKTIDVTNSLKPKTPTILSVVKSNDNIEVSWRTNMESVPSILLTAQLVYYKKGDIEKDWKNITPATVDGLQYFKISGQDLESSTAYVVKVRSVAQMNDNLSDSSQEMEFTTSASRSVVVSALTVAVSIGAIVISLAMYGCYVKLKTNWWDKFPSPKIRIIHPIKEMMLQPEKSFPLPVCIEESKQHDDKQLSEMSSTDSKSNGSECSTSSPSVDIYGVIPVDTSGTSESALLAFFANLGPLAQQQTSQFTSGLLATPSNLHDIRCDGSASGSSGEASVTYTEVIHNSSNNVLVDSPDVHTHPELGCEFTFNVSKSNTLDISSQAVSLLMPVNMCPQYNADHQRFLDKECLSLPSSSGGTNPATSCQPQFRVESTDKLLELASTFSSHPNKNLFYDSVSPDSHNSIVQCDGYQTVLPRALFSEERHCDQDVYAKKYQEKPFSNVPQSCLNSFFQGDASKDPSQHKLSGSECSSRASSRLITDALKASPSPFFTNLGPVAQQQTSQFTSGLSTAPSSLHGIRYDGSTSASYDAVNPSYGLVIPNSSNNILADSPNVHTQPELGCELTCDVSKSNTLDVSAQDVSPFMPVNMCPQYNTDHQRFPNEEYLSFSSNSGSTEPATSCQPESRVESSDKYQEESFINIPQNCFNSLFLCDDSEGQSQLKLQMPSLFLSSTDNYMPVKMDSDYRKV